MAIVEQELLRKWDEQHETDDCTDQERQAWFGEAAAYLQANSHWWCQHEKLLSHFAEIFVYHTQPVVQRLWTCMSQQLSECAVCVVHYHNTQVQLKQSPEDSTTNALGEALHLLDTERLVGVLKQALHVQSDEAFPAPLVTALFEVLSYPTLMDDLRLNQTLETGLLHLRKTHDLALTQGGRYQGLYRLMAHPNAQIRAMVHPMIKELGPFEDEAELHSIAPVLQQWAHEASIWDENTVAATDGSSSSRFVQPPQLVWLAMNVLLTLVKPGAMSVLLCEAWPHLVDVLLAECSRPGLHCWMVVGCLRTLLQTDSTQVWQNTHMNAAGVVEVLSQCCKVSQDTRVHRGAVRAVTAAVSSRLPSGQNEVEALVSAAIILLLQEMPNQGGFAPATLIMAAESAYHLLADCFQLNCVPSSILAVWGSHLCRILQQAATVAQPPAQLQAAQHLACVVMKTDASALLCHCQDEWGYTRKGSSGQALLGSAGHFCSPALWQALSSCTATTAAMLAASALLAFATGPPHKQGCVAARQRGGGVGLHTGIEASALPLEVQQAMHWHEAREGPGHASTVRTAEHAGVLVELLRQSVAAQLELSMQPQHDATLPREAIGDLLLVMVGVDSRLRSMVQQLLLSVTHSQRLQAAVLVLLTDTSPQTSAQVLEAARQLPALLQQLPAAQVLTKAPGASMLQLLCLVVSFYANNPSQLPLSAHPMVSELWSAVLSLLEQGAAAAKLSVAQGSLQQLFQLVPVTWTLLQHVQATSGNHSPEAQDTDVLDLTQNSPAVPAGHAEQSSLLWLSLLLEWGPLCVAASIMCWAEAIQQVLSALPSPVSKSLPKDVFDTAARVLSPQAGLPDNARLLLAPLFGQAAPGNLGIKSSLLNLPSRASPPPPSPAIALSPGLEPSHASALSSSPSPGRGPSSTGKVKQSSLRAFLSPGKVKDESAAASLHQGDLQHLSLGASPAVAPSGLGEGHTKDFIEQAWSQRLHGRQPNDTAQHAQHAQQAKQAQHTQQAKQEASSRISKQPVKLPEDIESLLPPEWGGKASEADASKKKSKQKGKLSLTAQYLHGETSQPASHAAQYQRSKQPVNNGSRHGRAQPQTHSRSQPGKESNAPSSSYNAQPNIPPGSKAWPKLDNAHSFQDWMQDPASDQQPPLGAVQSTTAADGDAPPPWFQPKSQSQAPAAQLSASAQPQSTLSTTSTAYPKGIPTPAAPRDALPWNSALPARPHTRSEERLGQLAALHHKVPEAAGNNNPGKPRSRSPSPMLLEDDDLEAELGPVQPRPQGDRALVGLPSAPHSEGPPRRAQMITIPAPVPTSTLTNAKWAQRRTNPRDPANEVGLTIQEVQRDILQWDYRQILHDAPGRGLKQLGLQRVPTKFKGLQEYCRIFRVLLLEELKAHLLQAEEERQRLGSRGQGNESTHVQLRAMQRRDDLHHLELVIPPDDRDAVRGEEIILLTQAQSGGALPSAKEGRTKEDAARLSLLALVDKVEREKEVDGTRKLIAYVTVCLQGTEGRASSALRSLALQSTWEACRLMSWTPHLRQFIALCHMSKLPTEMRSQLLHPLAPPVGPPAALVKCHSVSAGLRQQLKEQYNHSQQAAIASVVNPGQTLFTLIQGPPGTGKTSVIVAMISALLAKHYTPPVKPAQKDQSNPIARSQQTGCDATPQANDMLLTKDYQTAEGRPNSTGGSRGDSQFTGSKFEPKRGEEDSAVGKLFTLEKDKAAKDKAAKDEATVLPQFRVLVCAQSNAAIDEVISRLASPGLLTGLKEGRRRPGMVRMGRDETTAPAVRPWHMDAVAERYAERDSNTLKAASASTKGRQRCDDIKAQLDAVSVQIKQAEHAQHDPMPGRHDSPDAPSSSSALGSNPRSVSPSDSAKPLEGKSRYHSRSASPKPVAGDPQAKRPNRSSRSVSPSEVAPNPRHDHAKPSHTKGAEKNPTLRQHDGRVRSQTPPERGHRPQHRGEDEEEQSAQQQAKRPKPKSAEQPSQVNGRTGNGGKAKPAAKGSLKRPAEHSAAGETKRHKQNSREPRDRKADEPDQARPADLPGLKQKRRLLYGQLQEARQQVKEGGEAAHRAKRGVRQAVVRAAEVVACTLSSAGGDLLSLVKGPGADPSFLFNAIMIDEAAQALEPAALVPLQLLAPGGHIVLVGDPKQLPPTVLSRAAESSNLAQSLFERLQQAGFAVNMLSEQFRMHPAISAWPSLFFYQGKLKNGTSALAGAVASRAADFHQKPCFSPLAFFDCREGWERGGSKGSGRGSHAPGGTSLSNEREAEIASTLFGGLMRDYGHEVGSVIVLTPYKAQLVLLQSLFRRSHSKAVLANVDFATVDGFQGKEADVVLFSCVRAHHVGGSGVGSKGVGFLADVRRMNVGLTRARRSLWVIGHRATLQNSPPWRAFLDHTIAQSCCFTVPEHTQRLLTASREQLLKQD